MSKIVLPLSSRWDLVRSIRSHEPPRPLAEPADDPLAFLRRVHARQLLREAQSRELCLHLAVLRASEQRLRFLLDVTERLDRALDWEAALAEIMDLVVPLVADGGVLQLVDSRGTVRRVEVRPANTGAHEPWLGLLERLALPPDAKGPQARALASGLASLVQDAWSDVREHVASSAAGVEPLSVGGGGSLMVVPLLSRGRTHGVLSLVLLEGGRRYDASDLVFAQQFAHRLAVAADNARLLAEAQRAVWARDDVLAMVSHDLRTPLNTIVLAAERMRSAPAESARETANHRAMDRVARAAHVMGRLVDDLVNVASLESGRLAMDPCEVLASSLVDDTLDMMQPLAERAAVRLTADTRTDTMVLCDRPRIVRALANLVGNALKFTPAGGTVTIRTTCSESELCLSVADTGSGIHERHLPHVFDRFWQAKKTAHLGTGLGLTIVKGIAEAHGGRVWVESELGVGSTFFLGLPLLHAPARA